MKILDLQHNLLTVLLVGAVAVLVLWAGVQWLLFRGGGAESVPPAATGGIEAPQVQTPDSGMADFDSYLAIVENPVFFSDRSLPVVEQPGEGEGPAIDQEPEEEEIAELKARVAGIIITPETRMAMIADEESGETLVMRPGMSLEGKQAAWQLGEIQPRLVSFESVDGRRTELELEVNTSGQPAPSRAGARARRSDEPDGEAEDQAVSEARSRAEEIRRRVAERRAQLREEAERRANRDGDQ